MSQADLVTDLDAWCAEHQPRFVAELVEACRIPSISAQSAHAADVVASAEYFAAAALRAGFHEARLLATAGHPAVYAERIVDPNLPTALIYGHHDVQPVDPLEEWVSPPFEPQVRDGLLFARGAVDDKGQVWMHLKAVEAHLQVRGELPLNLKLIVEGEEEVGSPHFDELIEAEKERLAADVAVISDTPIFARGVPSLCTGLRGLVHLEVEVSGPRLDLHSGYFGGAVANPVVALAAILASLHDPSTGRVSVPGFYDRVREPSAAERAEFAALPFNEEAFRAQAGGIAQTVGEAGYTVLEQLWCRPTLEVTGIWGGYSGPGAKTIIPARAGSKVSCRLVPDQDPEEIADLVATALLAAAPPGVRVAVTASPGGRPVLTSIDQPAVQAARRAMRHGFGTEPAIIRNGGTIPPVATFQTVLGVPVVLVGVGLPDDQIHAPNEHFDLDQYARGVRTIANLWDELGGALRAG
jgi:acetylornithine deacetylase/succinyl-diaminopimelate desuccinylase-like protein